MPSKASPRSKKRQRPTAAKIEEAVKEVINHGHSINKTALVFGISRAYLAKIVKKAKSNDNVSYVHCPNIGNKRIFSLTQEELLASYLKTASKMCHGLTKKQTRELAFQYAQANSICPTKWEVDKIATAEWLRGFMTRHKDLSVRKPESTSLSRATSFNKTNVGTFFSNLTNIFQKFHFSPHMIFNADETGCSTVSAPPKIIATRGSKQVGQVTSAERGTLVTTLFFINAAGGTIPPVFIFPRVNFKSHMLNNGPFGALGLAHASGWMTENSFMQALEHFVKHVNPTKENPALVLLDNHTSHVNCRVIEFARKHSIIILTFPPHCSHKLQPLDVTVYGPFKTRYRVAMNEWMLSNPGKTVTIYQVAQFVRDAYLSAFTMQNVTQGFIKTGIYPLNSNSFSDDDFLSSYVTDRCNPISTDKNPNQNICNKHIDSAAEDNLLPADMQSPRPTCSLSEVLRPEDVKPFSKAGPRKNLKSKRKISSSVITDTPKKNETEEKLKVTKRKKTHIKKRTTRKNVTLHDDTS